MRSAPRHIVAAIAFIGLAILWSYPLVRELSTHLPGAALGDNALFLWNFWWMRAARDTGADFFRTPALFAPFGADLTLHTHTALPAWIGATMLGRASVLEALNVTTLGGLALNGFFAYLLAWRLTREWGASLVAGAVYATSPYLAAHLLGHFNLTHAWTLPLFGLTVAGTAAGSKKSALLCGAALALTAYVDYYYVVYELLWLVVAIVHAAWAWSVRARRGAPLSWLFSVAVALVLVDAAILAAIAVTGGFAVEWGPLRLSMRDIYNPLQAFWVLLAVSVWLYLRPSFRLEPRTGWSWLDCMTAQAVAAVVFVMCAAPLVSHGLGVIARGEYVSQRYFWRSAPVGVDLATLVFGNPFQTWWGAASAHLYARFGINVIESGAWLGVVPVVAAIYVVRHAASERIARPWILLALVFFVWALGPHLMVFGRNTGMILPQTLLRYVPIAANARVPGRAMVMVHLSLAMLTAVALAEWGRHHRPRARVAILIAGILIAVDAAAAPYPTTPVACPRIYETLAARPEKGALAELPVSWGDGVTGELTPVDHRAMACQMIHGRPIIGGVLARIPANLLPAYRRDPLLANWLALSSAPAAPAGDAIQLDRRTIDERLSAAGVAFVLLNRATAGVALREHVEHALPLSLIAEDGPLALYFVQR